MKSWKEENVDEDENEDWTMGQSRKSFRRQEGEKENRRKMKSGRGVGWERWDFDFMLIASKERL